MKVLVDYKSFTGKVGTVLSVGRTNVRVEIDNKVYIVKPSILEEIK